MSLVLNVDEVALAAGRVDTYAEASEMRVSNVTNILPGSQCLDPIFGQFGSRHDPSLRQSCRYGKNQGNYSPLVRVWLSVVLVEDVYGLSVEGDVDGDVRVVAECVHGGEVA